MDAAHKGDRSVTHGKWVMPALSRPRNGLVGQRTLGGLRELNSRDDT